MIERTAILHVPKSNFAYAQDQDNLHIILKAKHNDLKKVTLFYSDPFDFNDGLNFKTVIMEKSGETSLFDYYKITIAPKDKRATYFFEIEGTSGDKVFYTEKGFFEIDKKTTLLKGGYGFTFPWMNPIDIQNTPSWIKDTVWYQIFPERFANGDPSLNRKDVLPWGQVDPTPNNFFGGDLQGIIDHLDHLQDLGVNGLYLCPIFKAYTNHKYDTIDYFEIDPDFGDKAKFKELVDKCHKLGIKVMLDAVFNHIGYRSPIWQDVVKNQQNSKYKDWFFIKKFPVETMDAGGVENSVKELSYYTFAYTGYMPKFNTANPAAKEYLLSVASYWVEEFNIDAWRLDVANEVDHEFWRAFRKTVNQKQPTYILGEIWTEANAWLKGDQFDGVMNYFLTSAINDFIAKQTISAAEFQNRVVDAMHTYPDNVQVGMFNCLDSHDTARLLTTCGENIDKFLLAYSFLFTCTGAPSIYYGDEIGMNGENDPWCRKCMEWVQGKWNQKIFKYFKNLIQVRQQHPVLGSYGTFAFVSIDVKTNVVVYKKYDENNEYIIYMNNSEKVNSVKGSFKNQIDLISNVKEDGTEISLEPFGIKIFKTK
ncbi:cyclomaltodextrinase / maltogenic alpha-amylase / neopullulanase [Spiroplasma clarkii]|uniref:Cyclomaltodextrinase / maltogenic alpha-amylase / neopullulanase n=2 Tax=Spiroplasma clarkii TaxID=2139 RepID=A0A2K8KFD4_9MOLU|nr:glycoside hydrolase family 13 protein [Spiroplasma clarkii]ATX70395.1 cyclomaltodextrinase / maltogenic alpha-amylase / neopullulanase [Spiroplasma clarkii]